MSFDIQDYLQDLYAYPVFKMAIKYLVFNNSLCALKAKTFSYSKGYFIQFEIILKPYQVHIKFN